MQRRGPEIDELHGQRGLRLERLQWVGHVVLAKLPDRSDHFAAIVRELHLDLARLARLKICGQLLAALLYGLTNVARERFRVGDWRLGSEAVSLACGGEAGGRRRRGLSGGFGIARGKRRCRPLGGSLLRRSGLRRGYFLRAGRRTYGVRRDGCALWVGRHGFERRRPATLGRGRLGRLGSRARSLPLAVRLGRAFFRRVALIGRREALAVYACNVGHQKRLLSPPAETGSRGNRK